MGAVNIRVFSLVFSFDETLFGVLYILFLIFLTHTTGEDWPEKSPKEPGSSVETAFSTTIGDTERNETPLDKTGGSRLHAGTYYIIT